MEMFFQTFVNGVMVSLTLILIASGLCLIFGILHIVNFAHGEFYMLGGFGIWYFFDLHSFPIGGPGILSYFLSMLLTIVVVGVIGMIVEKFVFRPLHGDISATIIVAIGIISILQASALAVFGARDKSATSPFSGKIEMSGMSVSAERVAAIICCVVFILGLYYFLKYTKTGKALRAMAQDQEAARVQGVNIERIFSGAMFVSCALAAAAGALVGPIYYINPYMGAEPVMKAFVVVILGGLGSLLGAVIGGFIIGMTESFVTTYLGAHSAMLIVFLIMIGVLLIRPRGIFGHVE
jgi:branched-chain amino acid transport system permease protein